MRSASKEGLCFLYCAIGEKNGVRAKHCCTLGSVEKRHGALNFKMHSYAYAISIDFTGNILVGN